jgi:hypothetical protein
VIRNMWGNAEKSFGGADSWMTTVELEQSPVELSVSTRVDAVSVD